MVSLLSDRGILRNHNEDYGNFFQCEEFNIYVVADGMGGHNAGEVASEIAARGIVDYIKDNFQKEDPEDLLKKSIECVNKKIYNKARETNNLSGMGTTVTACLELEEIVIVANVGDSSSFAIKNNIMKKITKDHSLVQELLDLGTISEEQADKHPKKNIITRAVGTNENVNIDIFIVEKDKYDTFLLCSDGLTNEISKKNIIDIINSSETLDRATKMLVDIANKNGGKDNITVLLFGGEMK